MHNSNTTSPYLKCTKCVKTFELTNMLYCPHCGGILLVEYPIEIIKNFKSDQSEKSMWRYAEVLPPVSEDSRVTNGEGLTPLIRSRIFNTDSEISLYFKDESKNPSGSFKDRPTAVCMSMAKEFGCTDIVTASSGNGAASAACYASLAGVKNTIFVPAKTPISKVSQTIAYGGNIIKVRGDFSQSYERAKDEAEKPHTMNVTTTFLNPYGVEGDKTIAYEIYEELGSIPDYLIMPVGAGPILYGIYKGFKEICEAQSIVSFPKLIAVQAEGCAPIIKALHAGVTVVAESSPHSIASAISDPLAGYEDNGDLTIAAINDSNGYGITVNDEEIVDAGRILAKREGLFVEPSSAAAFAGFLRVKNESPKKINGIGVCILTGHGLKDSGGYIDADNNSTMAKCNDLKNDGDVK